jgi:hypothetical protein
MSKGHPPKDSPDQETRNDDPNVQDQREQRAKGEKDQAEGERAKPGNDERIHPEVGPRGDRKHDAREARRPGGGRKGQPAEDDAAR